MNARTAVCFFTLLIATLAQAQDCTLFQAHHGYVPRIDIATDVAVVYGVDQTFLDRAAKWREEGYATSMMTGISWGSYGEYYVEDG